MFVGNRLRRRHCPYPSGKTGLFQHLYDIDFSSGAVAMALAKNCENIEGGLVSIAEASVLDLPFSDDFFDSAITFQSHYYHWTEVLKAERKIHRILKPGGQFVLAAEIYKIEYRTAAETKTLFEHSGFQNITLVTHQKCVFVIGRKASA